MVAAVIATIGEDRPGIVNELSQLVHALEHGTVVIWHRPDLDSASYESLVALVGGEDSHVILSPNARMADPIVATAWNRLKRYDTFNAELQEFIDTYRERGPESIGCPI